MNRSRLVFTVLLLGGLFVMWLVDSKDDDLATAALHPSVAAPALESDPAPAQPNRASVHLVADGRTPLPGAPTTPQVAPRQVLPPKFPAEAALPAELLQSQKLSATLSPLQSFPNTFEGRMGKLNFFSRTNALPPPPSAPPEMQMLGKATSPPNSPPRPTPTIKQLRDYLLAQPGGREILEEAKRRGFRLSWHSPDDDASSFSLARLLRLAEAQAAEGFKAVFTPREPKNSSLTFSGIWLWDPYKPLLDAGIHFGGPQGRSLATFNVNVPREGMYWVTVVAYASNVKATLIKANIQVGQLDTGPGANFYHYWAFVHLAPGSHNFYWYVDRGTAEFIEVSVIEDL